MSETPHKELSVLLVDDDPDFRALVRHHLSVAAPEITMVEYDPEAAGMPDEYFDWRRFDVLLLDYQLGDAGDGLKWLAQLRRRPGFPPTVLVTAQGDEYVAVQALKLGAEDYLRKQEVTADRIAEVIRGAAQGSPPRPLSSGRGVGDRPDTSDRVVQGLNQYRLVRKIGAGTQSRIYLGTRLGDNFEVAVKIIAVSALIDDDVRKRFEREASALERMDSRFVVRLHEHAFSEDCGFLAMEYLPGGDLRSFVQQPVGPARATKWIANVLHGLEAIHDAGVIHRDVKPTNIMHRDDDTLVIADLGISRFTESSGEHTTEAMLLGTPAYMSPEQCMGHALDERADLYSTGIVFYEMLMGRRPYVGRGVTDVLYMHVNADIPRFPPEFEDLQPLLDGLMAKDITKRLSGAPRALEVLNHCQS